MGGRRRGSEEKEGRSNQRLNIEVEICIGICIDICIDIDINICTEGSGMDGVIKGHGHTYI